MDALALFRIVAGEGGPKAPPGGEVAWRHRVLLALETLTPREASVVRECYLRDKRPTIRRLANLGLSLGMSEADLLRTGNPGKKPLREIKALLAELSRSTS